MIRGAAAGDPVQRALFARCYDSVVRAYLASRWARTVFAQDIDDAVQEVFCECYRPDGALVRADADRSAGFRGYLYGITRNVALRIEARRARLKEGPIDSGVAEFADPDDRPSRAFDRAWAVTVMREAAERQTALAAQAGADAMRRVELLRLRFHENLPIREIAAKWGVDAVHLHREYARARREFKQTLLAVLSTQQSGPDDVLERECAWLLAQLA